MACLSCSIEMEPRTLNQGQLNNAMQTAAADLVQKMKTQKASNMFIEGSRPALEIKENEEMLRKREKLHMTADRKKHVLVIERSCECSSSSINITESTEKAKIREPHSAPF